MAKIMKSFRLDDSVIEQLEQLSEDLGISQAEILSKGVSMLADQASNNWKMTDRRRSGMKAAIEKISKAIDKKTITYDELQNALDELTRKFEAYHPEEK